MGEASAGTHHRAIRPEAATGRCTGVHCGPSHQGPGVGRIEPGYRIWLHVDGARAFGPGMHELLGHVADTGSLHQAAKLMGMSYTKAWHLLRQTEEHLGWQLVERQVGGVSGGGSTLTAMGRDLVDRFAAFMADTDEAMDAAFERAFGDGLPRGRRGTDP